MLVTSRISLTSDIRKKFSDSLLLKFFYRPWHPAMTLKILEGSTVQLSLSFLWRWYCHLHAHLLHMTITVCNSHPLTFYLPFHTSLCADQCPIHAPSTLTWNVGFHLYFGLGSVHSPLTFWAHGSLLHWQFLLLMRPLAPCRNTCLPPSL